MDKKNPRWSRAFLERLAEALRANSPWKWGLLDDGGYLLVRGVPKDLEVTLGIKDTCVDLWDCGDVVCTFGEPSLVAHLVPPDEQDIPSIVQFLAETFVGDGDEEALYFPDEDGGSNRCLNP